MRQTKWCVLLGALGSMVFAHEAQATCSSAALSVSPQTTAQGGTVTLSGSASCQQSNPSYEFGYIDPTNGSWVTISGYSSATSTTWSPPTSWGSGTFWLWVFVREASSQATYDTWSSNTVTVSGSSQCSGVTLSLSTATSAPGTTVTLSGAASCPLNNAEYEFGYIHPVSGTWVTIRPYASAASTPWTIPTDWPNEQTWLWVFVRQAGTTVNYDTWNSAVLTVAPACSAATLSLSTHRADRGQTVSLSASATCALSNPQYSFWVVDPNGTRSDVLPYSTTSSTQWTVPANAAYGGYQIVASVREPGSTVPMDSYDSYFPFMVEPQSCTTPALTLSTTHSAPGDVVTLSTQSPCYMSAPQFEYWLSDASGWHQIQSYSNATMASWVVPPDEPFGSTVWLYVFFREAGRTSITYDEFSYAPLTIGTDYPCEAVSAQVNPQGSVEVGTRVLIRSQASGCIEPRYALWHMGPDGGANGGGWENFQAYSTQEGFVWDTTNVVVGTHYFQVWAQQYNDATNYDVLTNFSIPVTVQGSGGSSGSVGSSGATGSSGGGINPNLLTQTVCPTPPSNTGIPGQNNPDTFSFPPDLPNGLTAEVGAIAGQFSVGSDGSANYTIPLTVPPGRAGIQPNLAISYTSSAGNGLAGKGFSLSGLSTVHRCGSNINRDGFFRGVMYDERDHFCLDGMRLVPYGGSAQGTTIEYRTIPNSFSKIVAHQADALSGPSSFDVYAKDGHISTYDKQVLVQGGQRISSWLLTKVADRRGNTMVYHYDTTLDTDGNTVEYWPTKIDYTSFTGQPALAADRSVTFQYYDLNTAPYHGGVAYEGGNLRTSTKLIEWIYMNGPGGVVRGYQFVYRGSNKSTVGKPEALLTTMRECTQIACKPETSFAWDDHTHIYPGGPLGPSNAVIGPTEDFRDGPDGDWDTQLGTQTEIGTYLLTDVNGDGLQDLVEFRTEQYSLTQTNFGFDVLVSLNIGGNYGPMSSWTADLWWPPDTFNMTYKFKLNLQPMDYDQDGRMDIIIDSNRQMPSGTIQYLHSKCSGQSVNTPGCKADTFELLSTGASTLPKALPIQLANVFVDLNGDGMADLVQCKDPDVYFAPSQVVWPWEDWPSNHAGNPQWTAYLWSPHASGGGSPAGWSTVGIPLPSEVHTTCELAQAQALEADTDGDGRVELLINESNYDWFYTSLQLGWDPPTKSMKWTTTLTDLEVQRSAAMPPIFMDLNGDGHTDAVFPYRWDYGLSFSTTADPVDTPLKPFFTEPTSPHQTGGGGTMAPSCTNPPNDCSDNIYAHMGIGAEKRFTYGRFALFQAPYAYPGAWNDPGAWMTQFFDHAVQLDWNGDGQMDLLMPVQGSCDNNQTVNACWDILVSDWSPPNQWGFTPLHTWIPFDSDFRFPPAGAQRLYAYYMPHVTDVDGDGRSDLVWFDKHGHFHIYNWDRPQDRLIGISDGSNIFNVPPSTQDEWQIQIHYSNLIDTGLMNPLPSGTDGADDSFFNRFYNPNTTQTPDATLGCTYPVKCVVSTQPVVSDYFIANGQGGQDHTWMMYRDGRYDLLGAGWLGFGQMGSVNFTNMAGEVSFSYNTFFDQTTRSYPYAGRTSKKVSWVPPSLTQSDPSQFEVSLAYSDYSLSVDPMGSFFVFPTHGELKREETHYAGAPYPYGFFDHALSLENNPGTVLSHTVTSVTDVDKYGNVKASNETAVGVDLNTWTNATYDNDEANWIIGKPATSQTCSVSQGVNSAHEQCVTTNVTAFSPFGEPELIHTGDPGDDQTQLTTQIDRDAFGNVVMTTATDAFGNQRQACVSYEASGIFPYATSNYPGFILRTIYDPGLGALKASADVNGFVTQYAFDSFGRTTKQVLPNGVSTTVSIAREKVWNNNQYWYTTTTTHTDGQPDQYSIHDGAGRTVLSKTAGPQVRTCDSTLATCLNTGGYFGVNYQYDARGRLTAKSLPWLSDTLQTANSIASRDYLGYQYDSLGRVIQTTSPWNTVTTSYDGNTVEQSDYVTDNGIATYVVSSTTVDALGRPIQKYDTMNGETTYTYGPFGAPWSTTHIGITSSMERDALQRVRIAHDPDRGETHIAYDGFGDVTALSDNNNRTFLMYYDALGRLTQRADQEGTTFFAYDIADLGNTGNKVKGALAAVTDPEQHINAYVYDSLSRPVGHWLTIGSESFVTGHSYDSLGRVNAISYPSVSGTPHVTVVNDYDANGYVTGVHDQSTNKSYWSLTQLDATGQAALETFNNKMLRKTSYDPANRHVARIQTGLGSPSSFIAFQDLSYTYNEHLNMATRSDALQTSGGQPIYEHFGYDHLDRLTCSYVDYTPPSLNGGTLLHDCDWFVTYQPNGNIETKSDVSGTYLYADQTHRHAVTSIGSQSYGYDNVGNQTSRPDATIEYTSFDSPAKYKRLADNNDITIKYDGNHNRIRKTAPQSETTYVDGIYQRVYDKATYTTKHKFFIGAGSAQVVLTRQDGQDDTLQYIFPDVLGSTDIVTDADGLVKAQQSYDPFGQQRNTHWNQAPSGPYSSVETQFDFTGQENENELNLVNMNARIYDPKIGRFLQTDPLVSNPMHSQSWNAYSYVLNNPLKFTDPTGMQPTQPPQENPSLPNGETIVSGDKREGIARSGRETVKAQRMNSGARGPESPVAPPAAVNERNFELHEINPWDPLESTCRHASLSIL